MPNNDDICRCLHSYRDHKQYARRGTGQLCLVAGCVCRDFMFPETAPVSQEPVTSAIVDQYGYPFMMV